MDILTKNIYTEKYRPQTLEELIFNDKDKIKGFLADPLSIPSFIFYSGPGTGKTTLAKIISKNHNTLTLNASLERGIDTIREQINLFSQSLSTIDGVKRCVFLDEADFLTPAAQASLRNLMEEYAGNVFFILTANDVSKIIPAIRSRCIEICFDRLNKTQILDRLEFICKNESIIYEIEDLYSLIGVYYPDIRGMILALQNAKISGCPLKDYTHGFTEVLKVVLTKDVKELYKYIYGRGLDVLAFNKFLFRYLYENYERFGYDKVARASRYLADTEKSYNLGVSLNIVALANFLIIADILTPTEVL